MSGDLGLGSGSHRTRVVEGYSNEQTKSFDQLIKELQALEDKLVPEESDVGEFQRIAKALKDIHQVDITKGQILVGEGRVPHNVEILASEWVHVSALPSYAQRAQILFAHKDIFEKGLQEVKPSGGERPTRGEGHFSWSKEGALQEATLRTGKEAIRRTGLFKWIPPLDYLDTQQAGTERQTNLVKKGKARKQSLQETVKSIQTLAAPVMRSLHYGPKSVRGYIDVNMRDENFRTLLMNWFDSESKKTKQQFPEIAGRDLVMKIRDKNPILFSFAILSNNDWEALDDNLRKHYEDEIYNDLLKQKSWIKMKDGPYGDKVIDDDASLRSLESFVQKHLETDSSSEESSSTTAYEIYPDDTTPPPS